VIDAKGMYVMPGGVDQHVHFSFQFNGEIVRGFESSAAAAAGGTTTVIEFVNQERGRGLIESIEDYRKEKADGIAAVDYTFHAVMTDPRPEVIEEIPELAEVGYPTMKLFMAYKGMFFHADDDAILKALIQGKKAGVTVMVHAENADMIDVLQKQLIAEGKTEPYYHAVSRPPVVEAEATRRAIYLAELADAPLYIVHVTCREALDAIKQAVANGQPIRGETCSHYLVLDESNLAKDNFEGAKYVCSPALRTPDHFDALWNGLNAGYLNAVSSDHCGFDWKHQKHMGKDDFRNIPNGAPGLQNRLAVLWTYGVEKGKITKTKFVELFATNPAKNNGIYPRKGAIEVGSDADVVIFDPEWKGIMTVDDMLHGVDYCSYEGMEQIGRVEKVLLRGNLVVDDAKYIGEAGDGVLIKGSRTVQATICKFHHRTSFRRPAHPRRVTVAQTTGRSWTWIR
jgi:dihydropyrimidinase